MSMAFASPSMRAAGQDLSVSISPLGLVELSDEEFEVHGPRLNRYAQSAAFYLGHHYAYKRAQGEPQVAHNYVRALADWMNNFCFGKGVSFKTAPEYEAIIPGLLKQVWEVHNDKQSLLWDIANNGGIYGDSFVKVAWEPERVDDAGYVHPGRVVILPLNPAYCYPEFHPHDRDRMMRFKLKYRFWGCVDTDTEVLTKDGWKTYDTLNEGDLILALDPDTDSIQWQPVDAVNVYDYQGHMIQWSNQINAVSTPNHRWLVDKQVGRGATTRYERIIARTDIGLEGDPAIKDLRKDSRIIVAGGTPLAFSDQPKYSDEFVETLAWFVCEGSWHTNQTGYLSGRLAQSATRYPEKLAQIRRLGAWWRAEGGSFSEGKQKPNGVVEFYLGKGTTDALLDVIGMDKQIPPTFINGLTYNQAVRFYDTLLDADGCRTHGDKRTVRWTQLDDDRKDSFQMLAAMLGKRSTKTSDGEKVQVYDRRYILAGSTRDKAERVYLKDGKIWCPTVEGGIWFARRGGSTFWTGNTAPEGTRQVFTYCEILTPEWIEEYINDELIAQRPNPLGEIPVVHIRNNVVSGSPWGLSDVADILPLNREYNEKMLEISDGLNYHVNPITIVTGGTMNQATKGANKVWNFSSKDVQVFNLEAGVNGLPVAMEYGEVIKRTMHELTGVPESALGQMQPISNTSGVALSIMYQPAMLKRQQKLVQYTKGFKQINEFILKTSFTFQPQTLKFDPTTEGILKSGQMPIINQADPLAYQTEIHWPSPLPIDALVMLNEIMLEMQLGLESKKGALDKLGNEFPEEKLQEIFAELIQDAEMQGALDLRRAQIAAATAAITGMIPGEQPTPADKASTTTTKKSDGKGKTSTSTTTEQPSPMSTFEAQGVMAEMQKLLVQAYGSQLPQRRNADSDKDIA